MKTRVRREYNAEAGVFQLALESSIDGVTWVEQRMYPWEMLNLATSDAAAMNTSGILPSDVIASYG